MKQAAIPAEPGWFALYEEQDEFARQERLPIVAWLWRGESYHADPEGVALVVVPRQWAYGHHLVEATEISNFMAYNLLGYCHDDLLPAVGPRP